VKAIHLVRYGLPAAILIAGVAVLAAGSGTAATGAGVVLVGVAAIVFMVNVLARLTISSQRDRAQERRALDRFTREGRWPRRSRDQSHHRACATRIARTLRAWTVETDERGLIGRRACFGRRLHGSRSKQAG
jgi:hypothetical protein